MAGNILTKNTNVYLGLLAYGANPKRNLNEEKDKDKTTGNPGGLPTQRINWKGEIFREKYTNNYNSCHRVQTLHAILKGD